MALWWARSGHWAVMERTWKILALEGVSGLKELTICVYLAMNIRGYIHEHSVGSLSSCKEAASFPLDLSRVMILSKSYRRKIRRIVEVRIYLTRRYAHMNRDRHFCVPLNKKLQIIDTSRPQNQDERIQKMANIQMMRQSRDKPKCKATPVTW